MSSRLNRILGRCTPMSGGCLHWTGGKYIDGKRPQTWVWRQVNPEYPVPSTKQVSARCGSDVCLEPTCLVLCDRVSGGGPVKLNVDKAQRIRELVAGGMSRRDVGRLYGVSSRAVRGVLSGLHWT